MPLGDWVNENVYGAKAKGPGAAAQYGSETGGALSYNQYTHDQAQKALNQTGPQINQGAYGAQDATERQGRMQAQGALGALQDAAEGKAPSAAEIQMHSGLDAATQAQYALAHSATGNGSAMSAAQRQALLNASQIQQAGVGQAAALRAGEMATARGQWAQAALQQRTADLQRLGMSMDEAQKQAQLALGQRGLNAQTALGYEGLGQNATLAQLQADQQKMGLDQGASNLQAQLNAQTGASVLSAGLTGAGTMGAALFGRSRNHPADNAAGVGADAGADIASGDPYAGAGADFAESDRRAKRNVRPLDEHRDAIARLHARMRDV